MSEEPLKGHTLEERQKGNADYRILSFNGRNGLSKLSASEERIFFFSFLNFGKSSVDRKEFVLLYSHDVIQFVAEARDHVV